LFLAEATSRYADQSFSRQGSEAQHSEHEK
jgi:hypothetical protein